MGTCRHLLAAFPGYWEIVLILGVVLILASVRWMTASRQNSESLQKGWAFLREQSILWIAQGFGVGRIAFAPGTWGSVVGVLWFFVLLKTGDFCFFLAGIVLGLTASVWLCGAAERILKQTDPPSVVLDEITALPVCFVPWVVSLWLRAGTLPAPEAFFNGHAWWPTLIMFALFRLFDILKPWPIRQSQKLPGGCGVTVDDLLAAVYVALLTLVFIV